MKRDKFLEEVTDREEFANLAKRVRENLESMPPADGEMLIDAPGGLTQIVPADSKAAVAWAAARGRATKTTATRERLRIIAHGVDDLSRLAEADGPDAAAAAAALKLRDELLEIAREMAKP